MLYDANAASLILGCLMKNPDLLYNPQYPLSKTDFAPNQLHKIIFISIINLAQNGCNDITEIEIDNFLQGHAEQYAVASANNHLEFCATIRELATIENMQNYYDNVRKFGLLRELKDNGYDITKWYDELDEDASIGRLKGIKIKDILDDLDQTSVQLRNKYDIHYIRNEIIVGENARDVIKDFENRPAFGALLTSPFLSEILNGWNKGHLIMRSAKSGAGKSRMAVADLCNVTVPYYYDKDAKDFVENKNYRGNGFFIHTELDTVTEMQPMFWSCVADVPYADITMGRLSKEQTARVEKAADILLASEMRLIDMPDFTSASLGRKIRECADGGCGYGVFDYMMLNTPLSQEYKKATGVQAREDMALRGLATDLKEYCENCNIGLLTMTQTNGMESNTDFPDESCIAGSKAMRNKVDGGFVVVPAKDRPKELKAVETFLRRKGFGEQREPMPNRITYIYKSRFGQYSDQKLKIFHYFDGGVMRNKDYIVADANNQIVQIPIPKIV